MQQTSWNQKSYAPFPHNICCVKGMMGIPKARRCAGTMEYARGDWRQEAGIMSDRSEHSSMSVHQQSFMGSPYFFGENIR